MSSTMTAGYLPGGAGRKYSARTVLLAGCGVSTADGNRTRETVTPEYGRSNSGSTWTGNECGASRYRSGTANFASSDWNMTVPGSAAGLSGRAERARVRITTVPGGTPAYRTFPPALVRAG